MNLAYFQMLLQESIDNATSTVDLLFLSQALEKLELGQIRTVATFAALPDAATNEGLLVWVTADERLYWSTGSAWYSIVTDNKAYLWSWGTGFTGMLGDNSIVAKSSPVSVVGGIDSWTQVSAGSNHALAITSSGRAWSWGTNNFGQLGTNNTVNRSSPVSVAGSDQNWLQISTGDQSSAAIKTNNTIWTWGSNTKGRLGDNTTTNRSSPVSVVGGFTNWCQVSVGQLHMAAIRSSGSAWAWGANCYVLGSNNSLDQSSPVSVVGGFTDWCQISAGDNFTLAVRSNGSIWGWGCNPVGQLGDNCVYNCVGSPVSVVGGFTDWSRVATGVFHSLGLRYNSTLWSWGFNPSGQLGNNSTVNVSSPVSVVGGIRNWCQIDAGTNSAGITTSGCVWTWGPSSLGDNSTNSRSSPGSIAGTLTSWCQVSTCGATLAIRYDAF